MQFRMQANKIQCIRSSYDPTPGIKRSHQKLIASFSIFSDTLPPILNEKLTPIEIKELATWFRDWRAGQVDKSHQQRVENSVQLLTELSESIKAYGAAMTVAEAAITWAALSDVGKSLRKAGHPKPVREARPSHLGSLTPDLLTDVS